MPLPSAHSSVNVAHHCSDAVERAAIRNGPAILAFSCALPLAGIEVDIDEAVILQARGFECVRLR